MLKSASKKNLLLAVLFITLAVIFIPSQALAYETKEFDVDVTVNQNNTYTITENIKVDFKGEERHGIYRYIPYINNQGKTVAQVKNVQVSSHPYESYTENGSMVVQIGDAAKEVTGNQSYNYSYDFLIYDDGDTNSDLLYLNLIPTGWETPISKANISVKLPFKVNTKDIDIYSGLYGQKDKDGVTWSYDEATSTISISALYLLKGEGITLHCQLPEGTWVNQHSNLWIKPFIALPLLLALGICILLWFLFGRDRKYVETVEFYPPEGMTPAEVGFAVDNTADYSDLVSMVTYFAHKGYLEIEEYEKDKFKLNKLKDISEDEPTFAITLFNGFFEDRKDSCKIDELGENFGMAFEASQELLDGLFSDDKAQVETSSTIAYWVGALAAFGLTFVSMFFTSIYSGYDSINIWGGISAAALMISSTSFYARKCFKHALSDTSSALYKLVGAIFYIAGIVIGGYILKFTGSLIVIPVFVIATTISIIFLSNMQRRTTYGAALLGRILGFKNFIETAELEKINMLVEESPSYFFDILPYAYVFGLTDKWSEKFETIALTKPKWYVSDHNYYPHSYIWYGSMMNSVNNSLDANIHIPDPEGGSGGGFSGGGFSGGGFGGGGGGAW